MYQPNLQHMLAKSMTKSALPQTMQDYNAALSNAGSFLQEVEKAHANPLPGCQSALDWAPGSAFKRDPFERRVRTVALAPSELAGVAETGRARVGV